MPAASKIDEIRRATVVLPLVPVTPMTLICFEGLPTSAWQNRP